MDGAVAPDGSVFNFTIKNSLGEYCEFDAEGNPIMFDWSAIQIDTDVDWNTPGVYEVKITFDDEAANLSNFTRCYVVVY